MDPCQYISHLYDQDELANFAQHCFVKYQDAFQGPIRRHSWVHINQHEDQQKFKNILKNLFDVFESIGQPLVVREPKLFYSKPNGYGIIHKDPIGYKGQQLDEYSKWACNIPAVNSSDVNLEFFNEDISQTVEFKKHGNNNQRYGIPNFYQEYLNSTFEFGTAPEEQIEPTYAKSITNAMILDTTQWHRTRSFSDQISIRVQYFTYWDLQKSYAETVADLIQHGSIK